MQAPAAKARARLAQLRRRRRCCPFVDLSSKVCTWVSSFDQGSGGNWLLLLKPHTDAQACCALFFWQFRRRAAADVGRSPLVTSCPSIAELEVMPVMPA